MRTSLCLGLVASVALASGGSQDPRLAQASRTDAGGWVQLHLEGKPRDIGFQYGYLAAAEIDGANRAMRVLMAHDTKRDWAFFRETSQKLFWPKIDPEYRDELAGMAEGLRARGYHYDTIDMVAQNGWIDIGWYYIPWLDAKKNPPVSHAPEYCSAFIATGSSTKDGKIVMGHNSWVQYLVGERWNMVLDIVPEHGHRILMDAWPGFIHSGDDFAINDAGLLVTETTIGGYLNFDPKGVPEFVRARKAVQYGKSIDDFVRIMEAGNNGGYANTWMVGDTKTNEIAKLELGLKNVMLTRSTDGAFFGCNYPENGKLIAEECTTDANMDPAAIQRKARWQRVLSEGKGKIDLDAGKGYLSDTYDEIAKKDGTNGTTLMAHAEVDPRVSFAGEPFYPLGTVNAKIVDSSLASQMRLWARMGFPDGSTFLAEPFLKAHPEFAWQSPLLIDIQSHPWTLFAAKKR